ncbi:hypothetical protein GUITHDRAFT_102517 [Guillardia theta CCMP2712]|uniref:Uncharacterized protein n=1 Tax=Guillardia theta (strain CCMP2712) TaxID=905079 RepID=L1JUC2_GUITC|nr:hypothetical protein GUITHDRAFT_102517 [Guillardia theta CCMP2712]EKX51904.1 hypothetical protein GUITHDRAFT_102517 [Guillardia theta CCMP2712]|eukprot:XP_005838884.1 hypothetical protein GUITHDRAFT_102517 [Guillardia theta CCMP2712]
MQNPNGHNSPRLIRVASEPVWQYVVDKEETASPRPLCSTLRRNSSSPSLYASVLEARMKLAELKANVPKKECEKMQVEEKPAVHATGDGFCRE